MTDAEILVWLKDQNSAPCILVEVVASIASVETTLYLSSVGYVTKPTDSPSNTFYIPCLIGSVKFQENINLNGNPNIAFGDIEIDNIDRSRDIYVDYIWNNRDITVYYGDSSWNRADFFPVFTGKTEKLDSKKLDSYVLKVQDKMQQLNVNISDTVLGGVTPNADRLIPLTFGEACNVTPLLTDEATHEYQVHDGAIDGIIEVRDYGIPVAITPNLANGKFVLNQNPAGTITASIQGDKNTVYNTTIASIIQHIVKTYPVNVFFDSDIDLSNFSTYNTAHPDSIGVYINRKSNILKIINDIADSLGSQVICDRSGKLKIYQVNLSTYDENSDVYENDIHEGSLELISMLDVDSAVNIGFCENYTIQKDLQTGILESHKALFANQWITVISTDSAVAIEYNIDTQVDQKTTHLIDDTEAQAESLRLLNLIKVQRKVYRFKGYPRLMNLKLGQGITIYHDDIYDLASGTEGMLISMATDWMKREVVCEVLV